MWFKDRLKIVVFQLVLCKFKASVNFLFLYFHAGTCKTFLFALLPYIQLFFSSRTLQFKINSIFLKLEFNWVPEDAYTRNSLIIPSLHQWISFGALPIYCVSHYIKIFVLLWVYLNYNQRCWYQLRFSYWKGPLFRYFHYFNYLSSIIKGLLFPY